jgi:hypothetical protein
LAKRAPWATCSRPVPLPPSAADVLVEFSPPFRREPHYRLMTLSQSGKAIRVASGSVEYLLRLARRSIVHGRKWIELSAQPASTLTFKQPRRRRRPAPAPDPTA